MHPPLQSPPGCGWQWEAGSPHLPLPTTIPGSFDLLAAALEPFLLVPLRSLALACLYQDFVEIEQSAIKESKSTYYVKHTCFSVSVRSMMTENMLLK